MPDKDDHEFNGSSFPAQGFAHLTNKAKQAYLEDWRSSVIVYSGEGRTGHTFVVVMFEKYEVAFKLDLVEHPTKDYALMFR